MKPLSMDDLWSRIIGERLRRDSIFDIPSRLTDRVIALESQSPGYTVGDTRLSLPVGPAAGPHTQTAQNLVAAWLCGARVFELKTVQQNDSLDIEKPCIDALDGGYNVEWSTELNLQEARSEYLHGWIVLNVLAAALSQKPQPLMFNMSVGYTLEGIRGEKMGAFIQGMQNVEGTPAWTQALEATDRALRSQGFAEAFGDAGTQRARTALQGMSTRVVHSVTLSTMHGCPPDEIERIGVYLLKDLGFDTYVKLNPTLLGYDRVRRILDTTGWSSIIIRRPTFEKDLQFDGALALISSLQKTAQAAGRRFGLKLSNTLANDNDGLRLPGSERYMSGRPLFPITTALASQLASALTKPAAFSFCAGVSSHNAYDCLRSGLGPLTAATEILKPGGYLRFEGLAREALRALKDGIPAGPDPRALRTLAETALRDPVYRGDYKKGEARIQKPLPVTDCFAAPCEQACPANQQVPQYIHAFGENQKQAALGIVLEDNPLPHVTGLLCDHQCMPNCSRVDYEGPVQIRRVKLDVARGAQIPVEGPTGDGENGPRVAVFGAGPGGLSCAHYVAQGGYGVTVFDQADEIGGVPANVIPRFRFPREDLEQDIDRIRALGVQFRLGSQGRFSVETWGALKKEGFQAVVLALGASVPRPLKLEGEGIPVVDALAFLQSLHRGDRTYNHKTSVVVVGGGNTAMDSARAARRLPGKPTVRLLYRRSLREMPADREEFDLALADGVEFTELALPEKMATLLSSGSDEGRGVLTIRGMALGEPDSSGRRSPRPTEKTWEVECDLIVAAVGETPDRDLYTALGIEVDPHGRPVVDPQTLETRVPGLFVVGDGRRGPASIISAEADGRRAAEAILGIPKVEGGRKKFAPPPLDWEKLSHRGELLESLGETDPAFAQREAERCLTCSTACLRCVEVCPNRANMVIGVPLDGPLSQELQILHVDELCNECGNCGFFCPYDGDPYALKPTLFRDEGSLRASSNGGFAFSGNPRSPDLVYRQRSGVDQPVERLPFATWQDRSSQDGMLWIAKTVVEQHPYLIPGGSL